MSSLTALQVAVRCDVAPSVVRSWIADGALRPASHRVVGDRTVALFDAETVDRFRGIQPPPATSPVERLAVAEAPIDSMLPTGLATLARLGRFEAAPWGGRSLGGAQLLGKVRFGADWLRVYRSYTGVVYHEQAEWMDAEPDWMDTPEHAETYALLEMAA